MNKLSALFSLFRQGSMVADPALWKNRSALVVALSALLMAVAQVCKAYGKDIGIDQDTATAIAGGIAAVVGLFSTYATSDKVGLPAKPVTGGESSDSSAPDMSGRA